jgi:hypothetical protein
LHDAISGERRGVPSTAVMTEKFVTAAEIMARSLGAPEYPLVVVAHPISSATAEQLADRARIAAAACRPNLVAGALPE